MILTYAAMAMQDGDSADFSEFQWREASKANFLNPDTAAHQIARSVRARIVNTVGMRDALAADAVY